MSESVMVHPRIVASGVTPDSVTHYVCPSYLIEVGAAPSDDNTTHHLYRNAARQGVLMCAWCGKTEKAIRKEIGLET